MRCKHFPRLFYYVIVPSAEKLFPFPVYPVIPPLIYLINHFPIRLCDNFPPINTNRALISLRRKSIFNKLICYFYNSPHLSHNLFSPLINPTAAIIHFINLLIILEYYLFPDKIFQIVFGFIFIDELTLLKQFWTTERKVFRLIPER